MQVPRLRNIDRDPTSLLGLPRINVIARQRAEGSVEGIILVLIRFPGLASPTGQSGGCGRALGTMAKKAFYEIHFCYLKLSNRSFLNPRQVRLMAERQILQDSVEVSRSKE
jgi:hypothetical protein